MIRIRSLRNRIAIFFVLLLLAVQVAGYSVISTVISSSALRTLNEELLVGARVFHQLLSMRSESLLQAAGVISADFGFRSAIASRDQETITSALKNQGDRVHADIVMLIGLDGTLLADTHSASNVGQAFPFKELFETARRNRRASAMRMIGGKMYQLVAVPVMAPLPIAWITMGFAIDDGFASELKALTSLDVSFFDTHARRLPAMLASSLPLGQRAALSEALGDAWMTDHAAWSRGGLTLHVSDGEYAAHVLPLGGDTSVNAVLEHSLADATAPFRRLQTALLFITLAGLAVSVVGSVMTARSVTRPIGALMRFARRIGAGDYTTELHISGHDEISELAATFSSMRGDLAEREKRIMDLAYLDTLTGLPNRVLFGDRLRQALTQAQRTGHGLAALTMDLDRFKYVNDTLGHQMGDLLLREVGLRLSRALPGDTQTVARLGGDEFGILLPVLALGGKTRQDDAGDGREEGEGSDASAVEAEACTVARRLLDALERPFIMGDQSVDVSGSIGIVVYPRDGVDEQTLIRRADMAMYTAKRTGSGFAAYDPSFDQHSPQRLSLMGELRRAVERDELVLYYQPKVDLADNFQVHHVEALVRWVHPERGFIPPDQFIPFAEQTGYIKSISQWVAEKAIRQCAQWRDAGIEMAISINVSARDLLTSELVDLFRRLLPHYGVSPALIWVEITESAVMDDPVRALATLDTLHAMGLQLSIDDFGTGYSSLAYLKRLPVSEIKIDRSFVMNMEKDTNDEVIVRSTIDLGRNMKLKVTAEGVENEAVMMRLKALQCDMAQGYFISRPLPADKFGAWLHDWRVKWGHTQPAALFA